MTNIELTVNVNANHALRCLYETAQEFAPEQLSVDQLLLTVFFIRKTQAAIWNLGCSHLFVVTPESDTKCRIAISCDFCDAKALSSGSILQSLSEFLKAFSERLRQYSLL